jgi:hypothetical protein
MGTTLQGCENQEREAGPRPAKMHRNKANVARLAAEGMSGREIEAMPSHSEGQHASPSVGVSQSSVAAEQKPRARKRGASAAGFNGRTEEKEDRSARPVLSVGRVTKFL